MYGDSWRLKTRAKTIHLTHESIRIDSLRSRFNLIQFDSNKNKNKNKNKNTFISEKKYNIIIIFIKYVTYNSFLETAIMGTAA